MRRLAVCLVALLALVGCETAVDGPEPAMDYDPDELGTTPSFVCNEAHPDEGTWVELDGESFSPLVVDAIASERDPDVELPVATLILREGPAGEEVETQRYELDSPLGEEDGQIRWIDDETLQFRVDDELELAEGVYDIEVENPNGQIAAETEAFGVLDRPELHTAIPEMTCVAQGEREITLEGDNLLVQGDEDEVPTIDLDGEEVEVVEDSATDCRDLHNTFTDHQLCEELTVRIDEEQLDAGVYDVTATNFAPAGCPSIPEEDEVVVTVNDPPQVHDIEPSPVCSEQIEYEGMEVDGDEFITVEDEDGETVYPEVAVGEQTYRAVDATGCEPVESTEVLAAQRCDGLLIDVEDGDLADQVADDVTHEDLEVVATNPDPVGCHSEQDEYLTAMPRPQVEVVEPDPMCTAQYENTFVVEGHGFAEIDGDQPVVHIEDETYEVEADDLDGCTDIETPDVPTASCEQLSVAIPEGDLNVERNDVTVENPETAGCESTDDSTVQVVPPPTVTSVSPQPICAETDTRTLEIDGEDFLDIDGDLPEVDIGGEQFGADELDGECDELPLDEEDRSVEVCDTLFVEVDPGADLEADVHDVVVTNPEGAQCHSEEDDVTFETVPPPQIDSVEPRSFCSEDGQEFQIEGDHFYEVEGDAPDVEFGDTTWTDVDVVDEDCGELNDDDIRRCETLELTVDPGAVSEGVDEMVVHNPGLVGCDSEESDPVLAAGSPEITDAQPAGLCDDDTFGSEITLTGSFLRDAEGDDPEVTMISHEDESEEGAEVLEMDDCPETDLGDWTLEECSELVASVPTEVREEGFDVEVDAPEPVACGHDVHPVPRNPRPDINRVVPERICNDGGTLKVKGEDLLEDAEYWFAGDQLDDDQIDHQDDENVTLTFDDTDNLATGMHDLEIINPGNCAATYEDIRVVDGPNPVYVDPPATFDGMTTQITIYAAGLHGEDIDKVELKMPDDTYQSLSYSTPDADRPNVVQAVVEEDTLAEFDDTLDSADFGIRLTDDIDGFACTAETDDLLGITAEPTLALESIDPQFGGQTESTDVTVRADETADEADQFDAVPRAYLNPAAIEGGDEQARELSSVQFIDSTELSGIVQSGLPVGEYDVIVVNPDGAVGVLDGEDGYEVTEDPAPRISSVSPGSWETEAVLDVDVEGEHFRDDPEDPTVSFQCRDSDGNPVDEANLPEIVDLDYEDAEHLELTVDTNDTELGYVCVMRVTNADGTFGEYSPITTTNPAGNFIEFSAGEAFDTPRFAPTTLPGAPTLDRRYLYVLGGDDGTGEDTAYDFGEFARIDDFGEPRGWQRLPEELADGRSLDLPEGRTRAEGVRIDDFLYLVGGSAEGTTTGDIHRARVLDPLDVPEIFDLDIFVDVDEESDLEPGTYYYRVSAVYAESDPANPGGESLASDPQPLNVPEEAVAVSISWTPPGDSESTHEIEEFRIYRSQEPDQAYGDEALLHTVDATETSFRDDGSRDVEPAHQPLPVGALGTWDYVAELDTPRQNLGVTAAESPDEESGEHFIYAIGGETTGGEGVDTYEFVTVEVDGPRDQTVAHDGIIGEDGGDTVRLADPRWNHEAMTGDGSNASSLADVRPQVFVLGGDDGTGGLGADEVEVATATADGHLEPWETISTTNSHRAGHAGVVANNQLMFVGGHGEGPSSGGQHAALECDEGDCPPPDLEQWDDLADVEMEQRVWMGHRIFNGFWYLTGGETDEQAASSTVDYSVAGGAP